MYKTGRKFALCALFLLAFTLLLQMKIPFVYTVNDDLFMKNIVSGAYLGAPDAHTVYLEYPLSLLLSALYRAAAGVPWYGILFFAFHIAAWSAIISRCLGVGKQKFAAALLLLLFVPAGFYHVASMQFTVTAAVLGAAGLVWFETSDRSAAPGIFWRDCLVTALFVFLSFQVRRNVLLMLVPMAGMLWLGRLLQEKRERKRMLRYAQTAMLCAAGVAVSVLCYRAAYGAPAWREYIRYNDSATVLYDYYGWPDYAENEELYRELGVSQEGWYGAKSAYLLSVDSGFNAQAMEALAQRAQELAAADAALFAERLGEALSICGLRMVSDTDRPLNLIVLSLYAAVAAGLLLGKNKAGLLRLFLFLAGRMFSWLYVVLEGRYPTRITQSLLLAECAVLLVFLMQDAARGYALLWEKAGKRKLCKLVMAAVFAGYLALFALLGIARVRHAAAENAGRLAESAGLREVKEYCASHGDNFYFIDTKSISNGTERIFDGAGSAYENYIAFGGWLSGSPVYEKKKADRGAADTERALLESGGFYVIFAQDESCPTAYLSDYFDSRYEGFRMDKAEAFGGDGAQFAVYRLGAERKRGNQQ